MSEWTLKSAGQTQRVADADQDLMLQYARMLQRETGADVAITKRDQYNASYVDYAQQTAERPFGVLRDGEFIDAAYIEYARDLGWDVATLTASDAQRASAEHLARWKGGLRAANRGA